MGHKYCCVSSCKAKPFTQKVIEAIESCLDDLKSHPDQIEKMDSIKQMLLEAQVKLTDAVVEMQDNWEMTGGYYKYSEEYQRPEYHLWMTRCMEDKLLERAKKDPVFKLEIEAIENDEDYPDTKREHIATILSTLAFNYILDDAIAKEIAKSQEAKDKFEKAPPLSDPYFKKPITDIKMYPSDGAKVNPDAPVNNFVFKNNQQA